MPRPRVVAVASHPIQYHAPWFRAMARRDDIDFSVLFIQQPDAQAQGRGFGVAFEWDIPLLEGYAWQKVEHLEGRGGLDGFFAARIADPGRLLAQLRPDVLILTGWHVWPLVQMLMAARRRRIPVVMRGEANALRARPMPARLWHRWLLARCSAFLPIGQASRAFYAGYGVQPERQFDAPYFVENERFSTSAAQTLPERDALRQKWSIPAAAACFCYAGKLEPKKRPLDLLEALRAAVAASARPLHLLVVGTGELMDTARRFATEHALPVTFCGFLNQTEIPAAYVASDCLVLPSDFGETWGLVVNEAMACGRPALVSDRVGCAADLIVPGVTGDVFPFGDTAALAAKLTQLAAALEALGRMGRAAHERVLGHYGVAQTVHGTMAAVRHVLGRP
jgi:glycosyltransferase involved in cell wall biosynthesis